MTEAKGIEIRDWNPDFYRIHPGATDPNESTFNKVANTPYKSMYGIYIYINNYKLYLLCICLNFWGFHGGKYTEKVPWMGTTLINHLSWSMLVFYRSFRIVATCFP